MRCDVCDGVLWDDQWVEVVPERRMEWARVWDVHFVRVFECVHAAIVCCQWVWSGEPARDDMQCGVRSSRAAWTVWSSDWECDV